MTAQDERWRSTLSRPDDGDAALIRDALYEAIDPWALLEAVRDGDDTIVDFVYREVNRAAAEYRQGRPESITGRRITEVVPSIVATGLLASFAQCVDTGEPLAINDLPYVSGRPGSWASGRRFELRGVRVGTEHLSVTWRDVNDRYENARRVAESEEYYRLIAENSSDVIAYVRGGVLVWISPSAHESLGAPPSYWIGRHFSNFTVPEDLPVFADMWRRTGAGETVVRRLRLLDAHGAVHWVEASAKLFYDAKGKPDGRSASIRVIDAEVAAEAALEQARREQEHADARYRKLIDNSVVATSLNTPGGRFTVVNQAICDYFGYDAETLTTKTWHELTPPEYLAEDLAADADIIAGRRDSYRRTKQYIRANGELIWGDLSLSCIRTADGEVESMICQIVDITAEMRARDRLIDSEERNRVLAQGLQKELGSAAQYLRSALPEDLTGPVAAQARHVPSGALGGDFFDFWWIDEDHLAVYLLDVSGHGVKSALVAVSAYNQLRSTTMASSILLQPDAVLSTLNQHFTMDHHDGNYLTVWFGIYQKSTRTLCYAGGGHPPALLIDGESVTQLGSQSVPVGMFDEATFPTSVVQVPPGSQLLLYSDGAYELTVADGSPWSQREFADVVAHAARSPRWTLDDLVVDALAHSATPNFEDDCSLVLLTFE